MTDTILYIAYSVHRISQENNSQAVLQHGHTSSSWCPCRIHMLCMRLLFFSSPSPLRWRHLWAACPTRRISRTSTIHRKIVRLLCAKYVLVKEYMHLHLCRKPVHRRPNHAQSLPANVCAFCCAARDFAGHGHHALRLIGQ